MRKIRLAVAIACSLLAAWLCLSPAFAEKRVALVIGNAAYTRVKPLDNPVTDARAMRDVLARLEFQIVYGENLDKGNLERRISDFAILVADADVAIVYYAGHGSTFGDIPYVVPVDAAYDRLERVPYELVQVETLVGELRRAKGVRIAILDACRDNEREVELKRTAARGGEATRGLARVKNAEGLIVAYATQYLATAQDGARGGNSPFTAALVRHIPTPGLDVKQVFLKVAQDVYQTSGGRQRPEISFSLYDDYVLVRGTPGDGAKPPVQTQPADADAAARADYALALQINTTTAWEAFLRKYSSGYYADLARARMQELKKNEVARAPPSSIPAVPSPPQVTPPAALPPVAALAPPVLWPAMQQSLGLYLANMTAELRKHYNIKDSVNGVVITGVDPTSVAAERRLTAGNVLVQVEQEQMTTPADVQIRVEQLRKAGKKTALLLAVTSNGDKIYVALPLVPIGFAQALGLDLAIMTDELRRSYKIKDSVKGVVITGVDPISVAADRRLAAGSVVVQVEQEPMAMPADVQRKIEQLRKAGKKTTLLLVATAGGEMIFVSLPLQ